MMNYTELQNLLEHRLVVIGDVKLRESDPEKQLKMLQQVSEKIDQWREGNRSDIDKQLLHFLDQYSLVKALEYIQEGKMKCK